MKTKYLAPVLALVLFFATILAAQQLGWWSTSGKVDRQGNPIQLSGTDVSEIKGWMTIEQVAKAFNISLEEIYQEFHLPADLPASTLLKDLEAQNLELSPIVMREWITARLRESENKSTKLTPDPAKVRAGGTYFLYLAPQPETLSLPQAEVVGRSMVEVLEVQGEWVHVRQNDNEGWLPKWYLSADESIPVRDISQAYQVLNRDAAGLLYPEGPQVVELSKGRLLKPIKEWGDWYQVGILVYDIPAVQVAWLPKTFLSPIGEEEPCEGFLHKGTEVYEVEDFDKISTVAPQKITYDMVVYVVREKDGYINVSAAGGWSAWTQKENLKFTFGTGAQPAQ